MKALISVSDKTGVIEFAKELVALGWEILSTSGTMKMLQEAGIKVTSVSDITGFPEICDGRVKTLHPKIHGALLAKRDVEEHIKALEDNNIDTIDLVCVNLYPFVETISKPNVTMEQAVENIDIGGPSMLRSAAKNWESVTVLVNHTDYDRVISELKQTGATTKQTRLELSAKAYTHTAGYDMAIATYMREKAGLSEKLFLEFDAEQTLRYGENPHQQAKFYKAKEYVPFSLANAIQLGGKELSYNNIQDANAALCIISEFDSPACVGLKHMNPCGAGVGNTVLEAWQKTYEGDKTSIFGGIVAVNREITLPLAELLKPIFLEIVMAPAFSADALELLSTKKNLRLLQVDMTKDNSIRNQYVSVNGGLLVQNLDTTTLSACKANCVTKIKPDSYQLEDLDFAWKIVKHVKSNAIVVVKNGMVYGVGAGQMNRIGSAKIALQQAQTTLKAQGKDICQEGLVLASDGFFPFDDCVTLAAEYGVKAIIQPGGSIKDEDSIKKADECNIAMLLTGERHFKH